MKNNGMKIKHPKLRGEWAAMCFMTRAAEHGLCVTRPWGEMSRYDFAVEYKARFVRVQVKSTMFLDHGGYTVMVRGWRGKYTGDPFDFVAAYLIPLESLVHPSSGEFQDAGECGALSEVEEVEVRAV
jgi:PD-(D/E)XK nuclease superfamily protein